MPDEIKGKLNHFGNGQVAFYCQGCKQVHAIRVGGGEGPCWGFNGDNEKPTFTPSILVSGRSFTPQGQADYDAWYAAGCPKNEDGSLHNFENAPTVCHSFVTDGKIEFLADSTHSLAGQTVPLENFTWGDDDV